MKRFFVLLLAWLLLLAGSAQTAQAMTSVPPAPTAEPSATAAPTAEASRLGEQTFSGRETSLTLILTPEEFPKLEAFPDLVVLDLSGSTCYEDILAYQAAHPQVQVRYTVELEEQQIPGDTEELTLSQMPETRLLRFLPHLRVLTVEAPLSPDQIAALTALLPNGTLNCSVAFAGLVTDRDATALDLSGISPEDVPEVIAALDLLPRLKTVRLSAPDGTSSWTLTQAADLLKARPDLQADYQAAAFGVSFSLTDQVVSFNQIDLRNRVEELRSILPALIHVGRLDMEDCHIPDEEMDALRTAFPAPKIVWRVSVGAYSCRTDAIMIRFSECIEAKRLRDEDLVPLTYCHEMRYLDLGHNHIRSAFFAASMPDLEVCILGAERELSDISALAQCPKLEYLEIFTGKIKDLSVLTACKELKHLNICCNDITDISPLFELDLERLWMTKTNVPEAQIRAFRERFPNCQVDTTARDPTAGTWRTRGNYYVPRYRLLREQFCYDHLEIDSYSEPPHFD